MSNVLSVATVVEKNKIASAVAFLIMLDIGVINPQNGALMETVYLCLNNEEIVYQGNTYTPTKFDITLSAQSGTQQEITLSIYDYSQAIQARMQAYGGGIGFTVKLAVVNSGNLTQAPEIEEYFEVIGASAENYVCAFNLGAENSVIHSFPRRRQTKDFCQWRYKSAECGYTGAMPSCDYSLQGPNGCAAHANTRRFGGFPGLNNRGMTRA